MKVFPCQTASRTRNCVRVDFPTETEQEGFTSKPLLTFAEPIVKACQDVAVFTVFTADQETAEANSSQGMFPLLPGGQAEQSHALSESRGEYYVNHKAPLKLKKPSAAAFRGHKRQRAREITWSPISRYGLRTVQDLYDGYSVLMSDVTELLLLCFGMLTNKMVLLIGIM